MKILNNNGNKNDEIRAKIKINTKKALEIIEKNKNKTKEKGEER